MNLTILSGVGTYPVAGGACSGYLVEEEGFRLWMDAGNGSLAKLLEHASYDDVDAVWISHAHADHAVDLYPFFYRLLGRERPPVPVFAPTGVRERLAALIGEESREAWGSRLAWNTIDPGDETEIGPFAVRGFDARHSLPNTVLRLGARGKTLTYTGDSGPHPDLARAAASADVFLCEATWIDESQVFSPIHLLARQAGEVAKEAGAGRLILTHVLQDNDPDRVLAVASDAYGADAELASRLTTIEV